jgi:hypothetical protein
MTSQELNRKQAVIFLLTILKATLNEQQSIKNISKWAATFIYKTVEDEAAQAG